MRNTRSTHQSEHSRGGSRGPARTKSWLRVAMAAVGLVVSSCASVKVTVTPPTACPGDPVTVSWVARGEAEMAVIPVKMAAPDSIGQSVDYCVDALASGTKLDPVASRGTITLRASADTAYLVQAQGWLGKPTHDCKRLFVNQVLPLSALPACIKNATGADRRVALVHLIRPNDSKWSVTATTGIVENDNSVAVTVRHAGKSIVLQPREKTNYFTGTDPNTEWSVEYTWTAGLVCGQAGAPVPNSLSVRVHPLCSPAARAAH